MPRREAAPVGCVQVSNPVCATPDPGVRTAAQDSVGAQVDDAGALASLVLDPPPLHVLPSDTLRVETCKNGLLVSRSPTLTEEDVSHFVASLHARAAERYRARARRMQERERAAKERGDGGREGASADKTARTDALDQGGETDRGEANSKEREEPEDRDIVGVALSGVGLNDDGLAILVSCMLRSTFLRVIDLSDNRLTDDSVCILAECLPCLPHLRFLNLSHNRLSSVSIVKAAKAFFPDFSHLLPPQRKGVAKPRGDCALGVRTPEAGCATEADEEKDFDVFHLDVSDNFVGPDGCCAIAETIKCNSCPARLYLRNIGGGCAGLLPLMATESFLKALDFSHADISPVPSPSPLPDPRDRPYLLSPSFSSSSFSSFSSSSFSSSSSSSSSSSPSSSSSSSASPAFAPDSASSSRTLFSSAKPPLPPAASTEQEGKSRRGYLLRTLQKARLGRRSNSSSEENGRVESASPTGTRGVDLGPRGQRKRRDEEEWTNELDDYCLHEDQETRSRNSLTGGDLQMVLCVAEGLAHLLTSAGTLQELNLSYCTWSFADFEGTEAAEPAGMVQYADQLVDILAEALKVTSSLRSLACAGNGMTAVGLRRLCEGLASPACHLEELNIACNDLQEALPLAELLLTNRTIRILDVANCVLPSEAVDHLSAALEENTTLAILVLAHNALQPSSLQRLAEALKVQKQRVEAEIQREEISEKLEKTQRKTERGEIEDGRDVGDLESGEWRGNERGTSLEETSKADRPRGNSPPFWFSGLNRPPCCCSWWGTPPNPFNDPSSFSPRMSLAPAARQRLLSLRRRCALHVITRQDAFTASASSASSSSSSSSASSSSSSGVCQPHDSTALRPLAAALPELAHLLFLDVSSCSMDVPTVELFRSAIASRVSPLPSFSPASSFPLAFPYTLCIRGLPLTAIRLDEDEESVEGEDLAERDTPQHSHPSTTSRLDPASSRSSPSSPSSQFSSSPLSSLPDRAAETTGIGARGGTGVESLALSVSRDAAGAISEDPNQLNAPNAAAASVWGTAARGGLANSEPGGDVARGEANLLFPVGSRSVSASRHAEERGGTCQPSADALENEQRLLSLYSHELSPILPPHQQEQLKELEELHAQQIRLQKRREELEKNLLSQLGAEDPEGEAGCVPPLQDPVDWLHTPSEPEGEEPGGDGENRK
ncbi:putative leucine rich repeat protein [Neospora caninum Liverpool]|uniref:Putative leucine rich repeat protein n=1 Tax=Neospora caninum (strain Liverpool) TaxID=572307 RepID=F0VCS3_NEOCL|nr:putative leucine rich repeat protein [Neospora caninum Liverpool]CBZ51438.1 putative leucine rich repeat protein [Neospora caninum Liverpool]|eukprot:XP_003881471.1 putative leucine rich repeat protein [Neospora caninum Liverpool]